VPECWRILLVDDEEVDRMAVQRAMKSAGIEVVLKEAYDVASGLSLLKTHAFDCALVDWRLTDGEGLELLKRGQAGDHSVPIIILTGLEDESRAIQALKSGAQDYLIKDEIEGKMLGRSIRYAIERHRIMADLAATKARLEEIAALDPLTDLFNRRGLEKALGRELQRANVKGSKLFAALIDLDDFTRINDQFGFMTGDIVLKEVAKQLEKTMRPSDYLSRIGRDEFLVLLPETRLVEAMKVADTLRLVVGDSVIVLPSGPVHLTASIGVAEVSQESVSLTDMLYRTGNALKRSKKNGKNQICFYAGANSNNLPAAPDTIVDQLCRGEGLRCVKQEIIRLADESIIGWEMLSRGPQGPFESPYDFFRLSIENSVLNLVDMRCVQECISSSNRQSLTGRIHVNLFPSTILDTPAEKLAELFPTDLKSASYCVELSEQQIIGDPSYLGEHVAALRRRDVLIALDDVGFGRSSLESLVILEPDVIKIDRKWIDGISKDDKKLRALNRMIKIAKALGSELVAEGIETPQDLAVLKGLDVEYGQGWIWGKPK
jgi:diguanylate cyclase